MSDKPDENSDNVAEIQSASNIELVDQAIRSFKTRFNANGLKATVTDFIRLLELQKQLQVDQPKEIKVTWIEPDEMEYASAE